MISIEETGWDSPEYDTCGNMTYAVLKINGIVIPLCNDCIKELEEELKAYRSKIHCYECKYFECSTSGLKYGGSCKLQAKENGKEITKENVGYEFAHDFNDSCHRASKDS